MLNLTVFKEVMHMITTKNTKSIQVLPPTDGTYENRYNNLQAEQSQILSRISHDLLNSLTLLNCSYQFIESQHPEAANFKYWSDLKSDTNYIQHYLISLSKYNKAALLKKGLCDLSEIFRKAVQNCSVQYPDINELLIFQNTPLSLPYYGDSIRLMEAVLEVLLNAYEAIHKKDNLQNGKIIIFFKESEQFHEIHIKDNADGIEEASLSHVCDVFFTEKTQHAGLGLPICSRILHAHNGHLNIDSKKGRGTSVTLCLPIMKMETSDQTDEASQNHPLPSYHPS